MPDALQPVEREHGAHTARGLAVTGGIRVIWLWRPGTFRPFNTVALLGSDRGHQAVRPAIDAP